MQETLFIRKIRQENNHVFMIEWNDGSVQHFRLCDLQRRCPCANCTDELTGQVVLDPKSIRDDVRAVMIKSVGRYGLQIQFSSGCSAGIYCFDWLLRQKEGCS